MKKLALPILLAGVFVISSCRTETVNCEPGLAEVYLVGFDYMKINIGTLTRYVANTDTVLDSTQRAPISGHGDTLQLFIMLPGYDYKVRLNDSATYFFNNIRLSGIKQQKFKRGFMDGKAFGCTERIVSFDVNGQHYDVSGNTYDDVYIR